MFASKYGHTEIFKLLIDAGADVNLRGGRGAAEGDTPLIIASQYGYKEAAHLLIEAGADIDAQDAVGWTAVNYAMHWNNGEIIQLLIEAGASVNESYFEKNTIHYWRF